MACLPDAGTCLRSCDAGPSTDLFHDPLNCGSCGNQCSGTLPYCCVEICDDLATAACVTTVAGTGIAGYRNGKVGTAQFAGPASLALDDAGFLYVADQQGQRIRRIDLDAGLVTTFAGSGDAGFADGDAGSAAFDSPSGMAFDLAGNLFVANSANNSIRKIDPLGNVTTFAGLGPGSGMGFADGDAGSFNAPSDVAVDANENVYVADRQNNGIRRISPTGDVTTLAGNGLRGYGVGVQSTQYTISADIAEFTEPSGLALGAGGQLLIADTYNQLIRTIDLDAGLVTAIAGDYDDPGYSDNGNSHYAQFQAPIGLRMNAAGDVFTADVQNNAIRRIAADGGVTTVAGQGPPNDLSAGGDGGLVDGPAPLARFFYPGYLILTPEGNLLVADQRNNCIRLIRVVP